MSTPKKHEVIPEPRRYGVELGVDMVDILVGPKKEVFRVHKKLLCTRAPVFDKMFNGGFKEATDQTAELPEDNPGAFNLFLEWIYTHRILAPKSTADIALSSNDRLHLYSFAEKYCLPELMDYSMSALLVLMKDRCVLPGIHQMKLAYMHTSAGSKLRQFIAIALQFVIVNVEDGKDWKTSELSELLLSCGDLTTDYLALARNSNGKKILNPRLLDHCVFHLHRAGKECSVIQDFVMLSK